MQGKQYQAWLDHMADQARRDVRRHKHETIGRVLYSVIFAALATFLVGLMFKSLGWL